MLLKRFAVVTLSLLLFCSFTLTGTAEDKPCKGCGAKTKAKTDNSTKKKGNKKTRAGWACPVFVIYEYNPSEKLYHADYRPETCFDEPQAAALFGLYTLPATCPDDCEPVLKKRNVRSKNEFSLVEADYIHRRPSSESTYAYEDSSLKYIRIPKEMSKLKTDIVARVNLIEASVGDSRLPRPRQVWHFCAWQVDERDLPPNTTPVTIESIDWKEIRGAGGSSPDKIACVKVEHPSYDSQIEFFVMTLETP